MKKALTLVVLAAGASMAQAGPAAATVLEIGDDGEVRTRVEGPTAGWETAEKKAAAEMRAVQAATAALAAAEPRSAAPHVVVGAAPPVPAVIATAVVTQPLRLHAPAPLVGSVLAAAKKYDLSPFLIDAVARQESGYRANAVSRAGAVGIMQLMPGTARLMGVRDPRDPHANIDGGARYLRQMLNRFGGDVALALAAYNAGPARVERAGGVPRITETQNYVARILGRLAGGAAAATQAVVQTASALGE